MNFLTLTLSVQSWSVPINDSQIRLALRAPQPYVVNGHYETGEDQIVRLVDGIAEFRALSSADLRTLGFNDTVYVLTVNYKSYEFSVPNEDDPIFQGGEGEMPGDLSRLIELVPTDGGLSPPPGAGISQRVLDALAQVESIAATLASSGATDKTYRHVQAEASATWTINHNLGKRPTISIVDSAGTVVIGDVHYNSDAQCIASFSAPFAGEAYCN